MRKYFERVIRKHVLNRSVMTHWDLWKAWVIHKAEKADDIASVAEGVKYLQNERVAILAVYQNGDLDSNILQLTRTLLRRGCDVVMINNGRLSDQSRAQCCDSFALYHERPSGRGRDFASYRVGFLAVLAALNRQGSHPRELIFLNDSVLYVDERMDRFLDAFFSMAGEWKGVTESSEPSYHVSSWFFSVSHRVWSDARFSRYWQDYRPLHSRPYVISQGELGLSTWLNRMGHASVVLYPADRFIEYVRTCGSSLTDLITLLPEGFFERYSRKYCSCLENNRVAELDAVVLADIISFQHRTNQSAFWQLIGAFGVDFPFLKKDIYAKGVFGMPQIRRFVRLMAADPAPWSQFMQRVCAAPDGRTFRGIQRLRRDYGID